MRGIDYSMNIDGPSDFFRRPLLLSAAAWLRGLRARGQGMEGQSCIQKRDGGCQVYPKLLVPGLAPKTAGRNPQDPTVHSEYRGADMAGVPMDTQAV